MTNLPNGRNGRPRRGGNFDGVNEIKIIGRKCEATSTCLLNPIVILIYQAILPSVAFLPRQHFDNFSDLVIPSFCRSAIKAAQSRTSACFPARFSFS
jgi:hypothetical protein